MIKWIIFYVGLTGASREELPMGEILFFQGDSLRAFEMIWTIKSEESIEEYGDILYYGIFEIEHKGIKGTISITGNNVLFVIEGENRIVMTMRQRPHEGYLYEDIEEDYMVLKKALKDHHKTKRKERRRKKDHVERVEQSN
jgi:hypothetical protein